MTVVHRNSALEDLALIVDVVSRASDVRHTEAWWKQVRQIVAHRHGLTSFGHEAAKPKKVLCEFCGDNDLNKRGIRDDLPLPLSNAEIKVLTALADGLTMKEIAKRLTVTENTVKTHLSRAYARMGAKSGAHAVAMAVRHGII